MYNLNFIKNEKLIEIFDEVLIKQGNLEKITSIALTDKRILFLDYNTNVLEDALRITRRINYTRYKEVYYEIHLSNVKKLINKEYYNLILKDNTIIEFNNEQLFKQIKGVINYEK